MFYRGLPDGVHHSPVVKDPNADSIGWYCYNSSSTTHPVGWKTANAWGLYDMAGNVYEWCHDGYQGDLGATALTDPVFSGSTRVLRGGAWVKYARYLRAARRGYAYTPSHRYNFFGIRCSRTSP